MSVLAERDRHELDVELVLLEDGADAVDRVGVLVPDHDHLGVDQLVAEVRVLVGLVDLEVGVLREGGLAQVARTRHDPDHGLLVPAPGRPEQLGVERHAPGGVVFVTAVVRPDERLALEALGEVLRVELDRDLLHGQVGGRAAIADAPQLVVPPRRRAPARAALVRARPEVELPELVATLLEDDLVFLCCHWNIGEVAVVPLGDRADDGQNAGGDDLEFHDGLLSHVKEHLQFRGFVTANTERNLPN